MSWSDYRIAIPPYRLFNALAACASMRNDTVLPSSAMNSSSTRYGLRPRHAGYALTISAHTDAGFQVMKPLAQCDKDNFGARYLHLRCG